MMIAVACAAALALAGCKPAEPQQPSQTAQSVMQSINSKNILEADSEGRLWYSINPGILNGDDSGVQGSLKTLLQDLSYISDGDPNTEEDLNMTGLLLDDFLQLDDTGTPTDLETMNSTFGTEEDLSALCNAAGSVNVPVMITLPLTSISKENAYFLKMQEIVLQAGDQDPAEIDPDLIDMFYVEKDHEGENGWTRIGESNYYYGSINASDIPRLNLSSVLVRNQITLAVEKYLGLGVSGFFVPEYTDLNHGDAGKNAEFAGWFNQMVKDRKPEAVNVFAYAGWADEAGSVPAFMADIEAAGAQGIIAKAATGAITARDLGQYLSDQANRTQNVQALFLNDDAGSLDLLKSDGRTAQYKMALALQLLSTGQVFIKAGDELGIKSSEQTAMAEEMDPENLKDEEQEASDLEFGSLSEQKKDGNSILNFVQQAISLRDSYRAISSGALSWNPDLSTDQVVVLDKKKESSETVLVFNLSDAPQDVDVASLSINGLPAELGGCLLTSEQPVEQEGTVIHLPAYSMALLK